MTKGSASRCIFSLFVIIVAVLQLIVMVDAFAASTTTTTAAAASNGNNGGGGNDDDKRVVFVRHGQTYMNEYLGKGFTKWGAPNFSDIFDEDERERYYRDSPLSPTGIRQAKQLLRESAAKSSSCPLSECELIVTSPLRRALQTTHYGLEPKRGDVPVVALPEAAERLYLVSDLGRPVHQMRKEFDYVDFETGWEGKPADNWWYQPTGEHPEWRPSGEGQTYFCPGEPEAHFADRMARLQEWLRNRPESRIAVVCHWGVIDWMLGEGFANCEYREVALNHIQPRTALQKV